MVWGRNVPDSFGGGTLLDVYRYALTKFGAQYMKSKLIYSSKHCIIFSKG